MQNQETCSEPRTVSPNVTMLDINGVAEMLGCSPRSIYRLIDDGRIPKPVRLRSMIRWPRGQIERWVAEGCPKSRVGRSRLY